MTLALELKGVAKLFGGLRAVDGVDLAVQPGERRALIGPNGAGKTTLFNLIAGALPVTMGTITLFGQDVTTKAAHRGTPRHRSRPATAGGAAGRRGAGAPPSEVSDR